MSYGNYSKVYMKENNYFKNIRHKGTPIPFIFCTLCLKVLPREGSDPHGCVDAIQNLSRVYREERGRLQVLEGETVDPTCLYINPVR